MTIGRDLVQQAFPNQPRMQAAFESLVADAEGATDRLKQAITAIGTLADGAEGIVAQLAQKQPKNDTLSAVAQLPTDPGVLEQIQPGIVSIRAIDTADTASLLTRALADTRYLGGAHGAVSAAKLTTARSISITGDVAWSVTFDGSVNVSAAGTIQANAVTFSKLVAATQKALIGANAAGNFQEITLGSGLSLTAGVLSATGGSGSVTSVSVVTANGVSGTVATSTTTPAITLTLGAITPSSVAATGAVTGSNLSGTNTGDQTSVSGNAGTATKLTTGRTLAITGDVTWTSPAFDGTGNVTAAATVVKVNGVALSGLATGILKNTTTTGVPSIAVAGDFPTLNQSTTGSAATLTTPRTLSITGKATAAGGTFDGSANLAINITAVTLAAGDIPNIAESQVTNLTTDLAAKAPLASPSFTGTVTLPVTTISGTGEGATPTGGTFRAPNAAGTDIAGGNLTIESGAGTGAGAQSSISFQVPTVTTTGTTAQVYTTPFFIGNALLGPVVTSTANVVMTGKIIFGAGDGTATPSFIQLRAPNSAGTDTSGAILSFKSGTGTGAGAVSNIVFGTPTVLTTGTTVQTITTRLTIDSGGITVAGAVKSTLDQLISGTGAQGYATGSGGTVTQLTGKATGVTLNKTNGQITMNAAALAASTSVSFTLTNSTIAATDVPNFVIGSGATAGSYVVTVDAVAAGSCRVHIRNVSAGSLSEALVLNFAILKAVAA